MPTNPPIIKTITTEKSSLAQSNGKYTFLVERKATKIDIKKAIKEIYGVEAKKVAVINTPRKIRILKGRFPWTKRPLMKKAVITLKGKKTIDPNKIGSGKGHKTEKPAAKAKK